jgi:bifunctional enzyme CysN/CysC
MRTPHCRGGEADGGSRPDRDHELHLAVPRRAARALLGEDEFIEIYVDTPLEICEARDPKGLYKLARAGKLPNLTGIGSAYEPPERPELVIAAGRERPEALAEEVLALLKRRDIV